MHILAAVIFRLFRSRHFRLAMLAFQFLWLNVIVPGHRRGIVALPGDHCRACEQWAVASTKSCPADSKSPQRDSKDPAGHCAICFFAARVSPAVTYDFTHPPLRLIAVVQDDSALIAVDPHLILAYHGRAPPAIV
ncbi:MAG TPA: hypothetical protein VG326_04510 [Tepidisphaeraceae bacterium]|jgi:hypothetical protein|nr:hypothetical protein [Tepidisphaeraceae bacterium]